MVKKLQKMADKKAAAAAGLLDSQLAHSVKESAQQIWLAGMGAFAKAQEEGGKVFEALVREGANLQKKTQSVAEERISAVTGKMTAMADGMSGKAGAQWDILATNDIGAEINATPALANGRLYVRTRDAVYCFR